ncbi:hypothetical protein P692DRAFT_201886592 [Suillus brevipes Sb2]|nr:hypothetical protein P692DRAFT_201886592 [Suillus brevipes Sb2]
MEAWTILDWTNPGRLGTSKQWKGCVVKSLTIGQFTSATEDSEERIKALLPTKTDEVVFCPLTPVQVAVYRRILHMNPVQNLVRKDENCDCGSGEKRKDCCHPIEKGNVLKYMSILIKISNHLALILPAPNDSPEQTLPNRELADVAFPGQPLPKYGTAMLLPQYCGEVVVLDTLLREWRKDPTGRSLVSLASSGIGGANSHCVVEGPPATNPVPPFWLSDAIRAPCLLVAGGLSPHSTTAVGETIRSIDGETLPSVAATFGRRSRSMPWRCYAVASSDSPPRFTEPVLAPRTPPPLVFVFSGQGPQHFEMGRELFSTCAVFQKSILEMDKIHELSTGYSLIAQTGLFAQRTHSAEALGKVWPIAVTLPALTMLQIATYDSLVGLGMKPTAIVGHSAGETALLYASGAGPKAMAVELAIARGRAMTIVEGSQGAMAAVSCSPEQAQEIISQIHTEQGKADLDVGCYNTPGAITLSGSSTDIDLAVERAKAVGFFAKRLNTAVPVHSRLMDACHDEFMRLVTDIFDRYPSQAPQLPTYSTESGMLKHDRFTAEYYWSEIGPHPALASYLVTLGGEKTIVACPLRRPKANQGDLFAFIDALGKLAVAGHCCVDFDVLNGCTAADGPKLPAYPFSRKKLHLYPISPSIKKICQPRNGPLNYSQLRINAQTHPYLAQHVIQGEPIMPAAGYLEMVLEFGARQLWDVNFLFILSLSGDQPVPVDICTEGPRWSVRSALVNPLQSSGAPPQYDRLHAEGYLSRDSPTLALPAVDIQAIKERCTRVSVEGFYDALEHFVQYGPDYRRALDCYRGTDRGLEMFKIHPVIFDSAIHILVHPMFTHLTDKTLYYLPSRLQNLTIHDELLTSPFPRSIYAHVVFRQWTPQSLTYDVALPNEDGIRLCTMQSFKVALHGESALYEPRSRFDIVYEPISVDLSSCRHPVQEELPSSSSPLNIIAYKHGKETELQMILSAQDPTAPCNIYVTAPAGPDGDEAIGFVRSLRKEYLLWTISAVVFDSVWDDESIRRAFEVLSDVPQAETELVVDASGLVHAPRITPCEGPKKVSPFNLHEPWQLEKSAVVHRSLPRSDCHSGVVHVQSASRADDQIWSFVGFWGDLGKAVMGISASPVGNIIVSPLDSLVDAPVDLDADAPMRPPVLALAISVIAVGSAYFENSGRFHGEILVTHADIQTSMLVAQLYILQGFRVTTITQHATNSEISRLPHGRFNIIVSEYSDAATLQLLSRLLTASGRTFPWKHPTKGLQSLLACDPWLIDHRFCLGSEIAGDELKVLMSNLSEIITVMPGDSVHVKKDLFSDKKAYLLNPLGGCMLLSVVLTDGLFSGLSTENFNTPFGPKIGAFDVLCHITDTNKLDLLISFSSVSALFGNAGQTNYAAYVSELSNTVLDGRLYTMPNAFSIVTPAVRLIHRYIGSDKVQILDRLRDVISALLGIFHFIEEGIQKLADGPFLSYIPEFDWEAVCANLGKSPMYTHLLPERAVVEDGASTSNNSVSIDDILCATLDFAREDLSPHVPLTVLSFALNPFFTINQTQLLANVTLRSLEARLEDKQQSVLTEAEQRSASELHQAFFDFETTVCIASGVFRVVYLADGSWKAHTVFTNLENLEGFPEQNGPDETTSQTTESGPRSVHAVRLNVSKIGGSEMQRCLHDHVWYDHMPYLPLPVSWPVFTPALKLADWLESYAHSMELDVWTSTTVMSVAPGKKGKKWTVTVQRANKKDRIFEVNHVVFALGFGSSMGIRFDPVYIGHFKRNLRDIRHGWMRKLYWNNDAFKSSTTTGPGACSTSSAHAQIT